VDNDSALLNKKNGTDFAYFDIWPRTENAPAPGVSSNSNSNDE